MVHFEFNSDPTVTKPEPHVLTRKWVDIYSTTVKTLDQFTGNLDFEFQQATNESIDWANSYFEFTIDLHDTSNAILTGYNLTISGYQTNPTIGPGYNAIGSLFSQFTHTIGSTQVTTIPEYRTVDTFAKRCSVNKLQDRTFGQQSFLDRNDLTRSLTSGFANASGNLISQDYKYSANVVGSQINTCIYQPTVGLFYNDETTTGQMNHRLSFTIDSQYKKNFMVCSSNTTPATSATDFSAYNVLIREVIFHPCVIQNDLTPYTGEHYMRLAAMNAQQITVPSLNTQLQYYVEPSTYHISYFEQSSQVGTDNSYPSTKFTASGVEILMTRAPRILYAGMQLPMVDKTMSIAVAPTGNATSGSLTGLQTQYYQYLLSNGYNYSNVEVNESFMDYLRLGAIYSYRFDKPLDNRSTLVQVSLAHATGNSITNVLGWVVSQYDRIVKLTYSNGVVVNVDVQNA